MYYVTHINQDTTISVKIPEQDRTHHTTEADLNINKIPVLGVYRNPSSLLVEHIQPIEPEEVSEGLLRVVNMITTPEIKKMANTMRRVIPKYFFEVAASYSGKYHPASNLGYGGLYRHTIYVCENLKHITDLESTKQLLNLTQRQIDLMLVACMMHDAYKQGFDKKISDFTQHPNIAARVIRGMTGLFPTEDLEFIARCVETHMGEWNTDRSGTVVTRKPESVYEWLVHLSDYLASRPNKSLTFDNTVYYKANENCVQSDKKPEKTPLGGAERAQLFMCLSRELAIPQDLKAKHGITRTDAEIKDIWQRIVEHGTVSEKQRKYVGLAKEL